MLLRNVDRRLREETQLPVKVVDQPLAAVVGAGKRLEDKSLLKKLAACSFGSNAESREPGESPPLAA